MSKDEHKELLSFRHHRVNFKVTLTTVVFRFEQFRSQFLLVFETAQAIHGLQRGKKHSDIFF